MISLRRRDLIASGVVLATAGRGVPLTWARTQAPAAAGAGPPALVRLSANENPYGPGPRAREALLGAVNESNRYAMDAYAKLIDAIAAHEGLARDRVVLGSGSGELLHMCALAFAERGEIVSAWPTFSQLMTFGEKVGATHVRVPLDAAHAHDLSALAAVVTARTSLVYVCNPNNPTGTVIAADTLREFCTSVAAKALVVVDEAYVDLAAPGATASMLPLVEADANLVVLRTFSKTHGLAGLRIGYALARTDVAAKLRRLQMAFPNTLGLHAARASLTDTAFLDDVRRRIAADRARLVAACGALGIVTAQPHGNFVFMHVGMPSDDFRQRLRAEGIEVGRAFDGYPDWSRVTVGTSAENDAFIAALRRVRLASGTIPA